MICKIKGIMVFYRHFFYGSALTIGSTVGIIQAEAVTWVHIAMLTAGIMLMGISGLITYAVNKYPEDFRDML